MDLLSTFRTILEHLPPPAAAAAAHSVLVFVHMKISIVFKIKVIKVV
jgi:hypothetical protein